MRMRTMSWTFVLMFVAGSAAYAGPQKAQNAGKRVKPPSAQKEKARAVPALKRRIPEDYRQHPVRKSRPVKLTLGEQVLYVEGRIEEIGDGVIIFSRELTEATRKMAAEKQHKPLRAIPLRQQDGMRYDHTKITDSMIKNRIGKDVRFEVRKDRAGNNYITNILTPKR